MTRRKFVTGFAGVPALALGAGDETSPLDEAMLGLLKKYGIPGGALAVARSGRLVYAKGFGFSNRERGEFVTADSRFRLASLSKPITAMAILRLMEQGKLGLDDKVLPKLNLEPLSGRFGDDRWGEVTLRHLLCHTGGWVKAVSGDCMFKSPEICAAAGVRGPAEAELTIRWMLGRGLDARPGTRYSYCNFGYVLLGRVLSEVTGKSYESAVRELVLRRCGANGLDLGHSLRPLAGEVSYYHCDGSYGRSVIPGLPDRVPWPYGTFSMEANAANGGWVGSAKDVVNFLTTMDEQANKPLLKAETLRAIAGTAAPGSGIEGSGAYHGLGWLVREKGQGGRPDFWYIGGLPGTKAIMVRLGNGFDWVALFNMRPAVLDAVNLEIQNAVHGAARKVPGWA